MFVGDARSLSLPYSGAPESRKVLCSGRLQPYTQTLEYAGKACQGQTLAYYENYDHKKFYSTGPWGLSLITIFCIFTYSQIN
jgi:hypothetical protein